MWARQFDPRTGRFLSKDPDGGSNKAPESLHPYGFANSNPHLFSDPSGRFTIIEINVTTAINSGLQAFRAGGVAYGRRKALQTIGDVLRQEVVKQVKTLLPFEDFLASFKDGVSLGNLLRRTICSNLAVPETMYFEVPITVDGLPLGNGFTRSQEPDAGSVLAMARLGVPRPDFVIGSKPPKVA